MDAPILSLSPDVLHIIFSLLKENSRDDVLNALKVCRSWHSVAQIVIDSTLDVILTDRYKETNENLFTRLARDKSLQSRVRHVTVMEANPPKLERALKVSDFPKANPWKRRGYFAQVQQDRPRDRELEGVINELARGLKAVKLMSFTWNALPLIPRRVVAVLVQQPHCQVYIRRNTRAISMCQRIYSPMLNWDAVDNISHLAKAIVEFDIVIPPEDTKLLPHLANLIQAASSSLRILRLRSIGQQWANAYIRGAEARNSEEFQRTHFSNVGIYQDLDWLVGPFQRSRRLLQLAELELLRFCVCSTKDFSLASLTNLSKLQKVHFDCFGFVANSGPSFNPKSAHLELWKQYSTDGSVCCRNHREASVQNVLRKWTSLGRLHMDVQGNAGHVLTAGLLSDIGPRLSSLTYRRYGPQLGPREEDGTLVDEADMVVLAGQYCRRLQHFGVNAYDSNYFEKIPGLLVALKNNLDFVPHLTIYCHNAPIAVKPREQQSHQTGPLAHEQVDFANVHHVWNSLRLPSSRLQQLDLHFGKDWYFVRNTPDDYQQYIGWGEDRRSFLINGDPKVEQATRSDLHVECLQLAEARAAVRQQWWEPEDGFWERKVQKLEGLVGGRADRKRERMRSRT